MTHTPKVHLRHPCGDTVVVNLFGEQVLSWTTADGNGDCAHRHAVSRGLPLTLQQSSMPAKVLS